MIQSGRPIFILLDAEFWIVRADLQVLLVKLAWLCWGRRGDVPEAYLSVKTAPTPRYGSYIWTLSCWADTFLYPCPAITPSNAYITAGLAGSFPARKIKLDCVLSLLTSRSSGFEVLPACKAPFLMV